MTLVIKVVLAVLIVVVFVAVGLRFWKLRRDQDRGRSTKIDRRLLSPPPSPYATSKGFRLLDDSSDSTQPSEPPRPRLEADHEYVFSETQLPPYDMGNPAPLRHDEHWALSRSARRGKLSAAGMRTLIIVLLIVLALIVAAFYLSHHDRTKGSGSSTTSTVRSMASSPSPGSIPSGGEFATFGPSSPLVTSASSAVAPSPRRGRIFSS